MTLCRSLDSTAESERLARLVNHSRRAPNLHLQLLQFEGRPRVALVARRDILVGEELLYDYGERRRQALADHPWLASS